MTPKHKWGIVAGALLLGAFLLFFQVGHYALWDDEAATALHAVGVWQTGDTTAILGDNIVATYGGVALRNLHERLEPPLQSYIAAPFVGLLGQTSFAARLPFALAGLATLALLMLWATLRYRNPWNLALFGLALLCNASFFLYARQSRYYALIILLTVALAFIYLNWNGKRRSLVVFSFVSALLFSANSLAFLAFNACLVFDYLIWGRKRKALTWHDWTAVIIPQIFLIAGVAYVWNPIGMSAQHALPFSHLGNRMILLWWNLRDLSRCEFGVGILLLIAPIVGFYKKSTLLLRGSAAGAVYILVITMLSPQPIENTSIADVRYLVPLIPLFVFLGVETLTTLLQNYPRIAFLAGVLCFGTNILSGAATSPASVRSSIVRFVNELLARPKNPFRVASEWVRQNVPAKSSVWVLPDYMTYPLMYHASQPIYAWQLENPPKPQFAGLPKIHFQGIIPPDYIVVFGPLSLQIRPILTQWEQKGVKYKQIATLESYWKDTYRPELLWRTFGEVTSYNMDAEAIYVFRRIEPPSIETAP